MKLVKVAVVQDGGILFDAEAGIAKAERLLAESAGVDLVAGWAPKGGGTMSCSAPSLRSLQPIR